MATKKLKTGQRVMVKSIYRWAVVLDKAEGWLEPSRSSARRMAAILGGRVIRLNPITGVVSK